VDSKKTEKLKTDMLRSIGEQFVNSWSQSGRRKGRLWSLWWEGVAEKESFKPGMRVKV